MCGVPRRSRLNDTSPSPSSRPFIYFLGPAAFAFSTRFTIVASSIRNARVMLWMAEVDVVGK